MSALLIVGLVLAGLAALVTTVLGVMALLGRSHPPVLSLVLWLLPAGTAVLGARMVTAWSVEQSIAEQAWFDWTSRLGADSEAAWTAVVWLGGALVILPLLPLLLAAIAGAMRGPRRIWLAAAQLGLGVLGAVVTVPFVALSVPDIPVTTFVVPLGLVILTLPVALASLAGKETVGPSAASLAATSAATSMLGMCLILLASSQAQIIAAVGFAPLDMVDSLFQGGQAIHALALPAAIIPMGFAAGWIALAEGARQGTAGRWGASLAGVLGFIALPLLVMGADAHDLTSRVSAARASAPTPQVPADVQLPLVNEAWGQSALSPGYPALLLAADGAQWLPPSGDAIPLEAPPTADFLRDRWPLETAPPLVVDERVPTGAVVQFVSGFDNAYDPVTVMVLTPHYIDDEPPYRASMNLAIAQSQMIDEDAFDGGAMIIDAEFLQAAGCMDAPCTEAGLEKAMGGRYKSNNQVLVDPRVQFGITAKIVSILAGSGYTASVGIIRTP